jgi:hypothetical protein
MPLEGDYPAPERGRIAWKCLSPSTDAVELTSRVASGDFNFFQRIELKKILILVFSILK